VASLLEKLAETVSSRTDLTVEGDVNDLVNIHTTLPKQNELEDILQHILDEPSFLSFRETLSKSHYSCY